MTIREQIEKTIGHYRRNLKVTTVMFLLGNLGMVVLLGSESCLSFGAPNSTWSLVVLVAVGLLYGGGGLGIFAFDLLMRLTAKCPKCNKRFRTLRKDWTFCPFCGTNFEQVLEENR